MHTNRNDMTCTRVDSHHGRDLNLNADGNVNF